MCKFFSAISDGKGQTLFFSIEDIVKEMSNGNPKQYEWNSHTSIAFFCGIKEANEDQWNKWEYDTNTKELKADQLNTKDDSIKVKKKIEKYLEGKDFVFLQNFYNYNSGDYNSGYNNSGDNNSGDNNSGYNNSGDYNSGNHNSGNHNSGNHNSGYYNSGYYNSGYYNSGYYNSGHKNSGHNNSGYYNSGHNNSGDNNSGNHNSGYYNSGHKNSGYYNSGNNNSGYNNSGDYNSGNNNSGYNNSGDYNSGNYNSGDNNSGNFNTKKTITLFNKETKKENIDFPSYMSFALVEWIATDKMSKEEKQNYPNHITTGGYLKTLDYKEAWRKAWDGASKEEKEATLKLPNFNAKIFEEITGIDVKKEKIK